MGVKWSIEAKERCKARMKGSGNNRYGTKHSEETKRKQKEAHLGDKAYNWKGMETLSYRLIHTRIAQRYGKADRCENKNCPQISVWYEWALKKGKTHGPFRSNYKMLCRKCHSVYDRQLEKAWITRRNNINNKKQNG